MTYSHQPRSSAQHIRYERMSDIQLMIAYFTAWNERDAASLAAVFSSAGTYEDPVWSGPVHGQQFRDYLKTFWAAFPDLFMDVASLDRLESGAAIGQWTMCATHCGPLFGEGPSHRTVNVRGADLFFFNGGLIETVISRFDALELIRQMGYDVALRGEREIRIAPSAQLPDLLN